MHFDDPFHLPLVFDYGATFFWAISGALIAARRGYDFTGVVALAVVSSTGGGLIRDGFFLQNAPPIVLRSPAYLLLAGLASVIVMIVGRYIARLPTFDQIIALVDAVGVGAYGLVGMQLSISFGLPWAAAVFVGIVNAVGGGALRDVLVRREPDLFKPGTPLVVGALVGCLFFLVLTHIFDVGETLAAWITIAVVFLLRILAIRFDLRTLRPMGFDQIGNEGT